MILIDIKRIDKTLHLPEYATPGSVGFDLVCRVETEIAPMKIERIPCNVIVKLPHGYTLLVTLRSSTPGRKGLMMPHGVGIIDQDYCGEGDEVMVQVLNFRNESVTISRGERIAQGIIVPVEVATWHEVDEVGVGRGGFGSTGISIVEREVISEPIPLNRKRSTLTEREQEVLELIRTGRKNREIADALEIAESTVHKHVQNIYEKLKVRNRVEALNRVQEGA